MNLIIGDILMFLVACTSIVTAVLQVAKIFLSQQYKDIRQAKRIEVILNSNTHLMKNDSAFVSRDFIYGHKNAGKSPCDLKELKIDEIHLPSDSSVFFEKEITKS